MEYLYKFYYQNDRQMYLEEKKRRSEHPTTVHLNFNITPYDMKESFQVYFIPTMKMLKNIEKIYEMDNKLRGIFNALPPVAKASYQIDMVISELLSTNKIEGIKSSRNEIAESTRSVIDRKTNKSVRFQSMIRSYLDIPFSHTMKLPSSSQDVREIYDKIAFEEVKTGDQLDGEIFRNDVVNVLTSTGKIIHQGIKGHELIVSEMNKLLDFLNRDKETPYLLKIAFSHYFFGYIHPFYDGNGRASRYLNSLYLSEKFSDLTAVSLSRAIESSKNDYYEIFRKTNAAISNGELNYFIETYLSFIIKGQEIIREEIAGKNAMLKDAYEKMESDEKLESLKPDHKQAMRMVAERYLFLEEEGMTAKLLSRQADYSENKARKILKELVDSNLLESTGNRPKKYFPLKDYFKLHL